MTLTVAGEGSAEIALDGVPAAALATDAPTPGPYDYVEIGAPLAAAEGVRDLRIRLRGTLRLAHVGFSG